MAAAEFKAQGLMDDIKQRDHRIKELEVDIQKLKMSQGDKDSLADSMKQ